MTECGKRPKISNGKAVTLTVTIPFEFRIMLSSNRNKAIKIKTL